MTRVVLFSSGVGYFEHNGPVTGNVTADLRFETAQINDVLKSLVVYDKGGGSVRTITYPANDPGEPHAPQFPGESLGRSAPR